MALYLQSHGKIGFTGGHGVSEAWTSNNSGTPEHWHQNRCKGVNRCAPTVKQSGIDVRMQRVAHTRTARAVSPACFLAPAVMTGYCSHPRAISGASEEERVQTPQSA